MDDNKLSKLTEKQKRFIDYYIETGNCSEAARLAGYSVKCSEQIGAQNYTKLKEFIDIELAKKQSSRIASQDEVLEYLTRVIRGEETEVVFIPFEGEQEKPPSIKDRNDAAKQLARVYGLDRLAKDKLALDRERLEVEKNKADKETGETVIKVYSNIPRPIPETDGEDE